MVTATQIGDRTICYPYQVINPTLLVCIWCANPLAESGGYRAMPEPTRTDHIWAVALPADLPPGVHRIEVEATDAFGLTSTSQTLVRVLAPADPWKEADKTSRRK